MKAYIINGKKLKDWKSFHKEFATKMDFPEYYGENMNAWIDCVDELSDEPTLISVTNGRTLKEDYPMLLRAILECAAFVNYRNIEVGRTANLMVAVDDK